MTDLATMTNDVKTSRPVISLHSRKILLILLATSWALCCISFILLVAESRYGLPVRKLRLFFDVSLERNFPTFFTVLLMFFISTATTFIAALSVRVKSLYTSKWIVLAIGFLYMAYDDGFHVHEDLVAVVRPLLWDGRLGPFYYAWVIPGLLVVCLLYLYFHRFLFSLKRTQRFRFVLSAAIYLSGSIGMEMVGGYYDELWGSRNLTYNLISTIEECLEMTGLSFFIFSLLEYIRETSAEIFLIIKK